MVRQIVDSRGRTVLTTVPEVIGQRIQPVFREAASWLVRHLDAVPPQPAELAIGLSGGIEHAAAAED